MMEIPSACDNCLSHLKACEVQSVYERWVPADEWDETFENLQLSASQGCAICKIHLDAILAEEAGSASHDAGTGLIGNSNVTISHQWVAKGDVGTDMSDLATLVVSGQPFDLFAYPKSPASQYITNQPTNPEKSGPVTLSKIQQWIDDCVSGHRRASNRCGASSCTELPPRVIEVSRSSNQRLQARLVEPGSQNARYIALSYCWGPEKWNPLTTTQNNYNRHCVSLPIKDCAQTIQDAITTTDQLGFRYLWVDALCIIQDSNADKDFQISKMRSIFENAFITLVAAYGEHASCGFLSMPTESKQIVFKLPYTHPNMGEGEIGTIYATRGESKNRMQDQPINLRAWTLEERLLSRRKIIFFADHVSWECFEVSLADLGEIENMGDDMRLPLPILYPEQRIFTPEDLMWSVHTEWVKNIEWYTRRSLTRPSDKLRAIGGIAQKYQHIFKVEYLAGLWADYILPGLLWRRIVDVDTESLHSRPLNFRAPSWSWAAIDGKVEYGWPDREDGSLEVARLGHEKSLATIVKPVITRQSINLKAPNKPFGAVVGGCIEISGMITRVQGTLQPGNYGEFGQTLQLRQDFPSAGTRKDIGELFLEIWPDATGDLTVGKADLYLLGLTGAGEDTRINDLYTKDMTFVIRGLVVSQKGQEKYSRIGFFEFWHHEYYDLLNMFSKQVLSLY